MKSNTIASLLVLAATTAITRAGTPAPSPEIAAAKEAPWITPTIDIRLRYEFADIDGLDPAHALTIRERIGFKTRAWGGFSLVADGDFVVGLYTAPDNRAAQQAQTVAALQALTLVSNSDWSADWRTLQALGVRSLMDVKTWRQMVLAVARGRADVLLAPFPATQDLALDAEGQRLVPLRGRALALMGARHLAAAPTPAGQAVAGKVFPALAALVTSGAVRRAYQECGFYNPRTSGWKVINKKASGAR